MGGSPDRGVEGNEEQEVAEEEYGCEPKKHVHEEVHDVELPALPCKCPASEPSRMVVESRDS